MKLVREYLELHFIVFLWGFSAILGLLITMPVVEMVFYRTLLATLALVIIVKAKSLSFKLSGKAITALLLTGVLFAAHWILFFASARVSNASVSLVGYATVAFWTSLLEPWVFKARVRAYEVILGLTVVGGIYLIFQFEFEYALGLSLAIGCAIFAAVFAVLNKLFIRSFNHHVIAFYEMGGATLSILLFFPFYVNFISETGQLQWIPSLSDLGYLLILAFVVTVYTISASIRLMKQLSAYAISLVLNLEPVYGVILALLIFGETEKMGGGFYLGALIIIASVLIHPALDRYLKKPSSLIH